jgi:hypothetical protein
LGLLPWYQHPFSLLVHFHQKSKIKIKIEVLFKGFQSLEVTKKLFKKISDPYDLGSNV